MVGIILFFGVCFMENKKKIILTTLLLCLGLFSENTVAIMPLEADTHSPYYIYDPICPYFFYCNNSESTEQTTILYLAGWPESSFVFSFKMLVDSIQQQNIQKPYQVLSPIFEMQKRKLGAVGGEFNTAFGQEADIKCVLYHLKNIIQNSTGTIIISCRSRGGAVGTNLLGILGKKNHKLLQQCSISETQRLQIIDRITAINFLVPLVDVKEVIHSRFNKFLSPILYYVVLPLATSLLFNPFSSIKPLLMINEWPQELILKQVPINVFFVNHDKVIGNITDKQFIETLKQCGINVNSTFLNDGHNGPIVFSALIDTTINYIA